jgi:hypothetical protein
MATVFINPTEKHFFKVYIALLFYSEQSRIELEVASKN